MNERDRNLLLLQALEEKQRRQRQLPLRYVEFHEGQLRALEAKKQKRGMLLLAGNRFGKTFLSGALARAHAIGYYPWEVPDLQPDAQGHYPHRSQVPPQYWIRRTDGVPIRLGGRGLMLTGLTRERGIGAVLFPALESACTPAERKDWRVWHGPSHVPLRLQFHDDAEVYFGSSEQEPMNFEGIPFDWVACDEPPPRAIWGAVWRGMTDYLAPFWYTMTPLGRNAPFVYEEFVAKERDDVALCHGSIWDNPFISHEAKTAFLDDGDYTEEERSARESGNWSFLSHRAFPTFDSAAHIVDQRRINPDWTRVCVVDPAHRRPFAIVWLAFGPNGEVEIYDEYPMGADHARMRSSTLTVADYATLIRNREGTLGAHLRVLDPRFGVAEFSVKGERQTSIQTDFRRYGLLFDTRVPDTGREETGIEKIRALLRWDRQSPLGPGNAPRLRVQRHCQNSIAALAQSNFVPPNARDTLLLPEKLTEIYKDHRDCIRYGVLYPRPAREPVLEYISSPAMKVQNDVFSG